MTQIDPAMREPKGDHNRRLSLGVDPDRFAALAGISTEDLRKYELTSPDENFDLEIARRVGETLDRLEADPPPTEAVRN